MNLEKTKEWWLARARREPDMTIGAGAVSAMRTAITETARLAQLDSTMRKIERDWLIAQLSFERERIDAYHAATMAMGQSVAQSSHLPQIRDDVVAAYTQLERVMIDVRERYKARYEKFQKQLADLAVETAKQ